MDTAPVVDGLAKPEVALTNKDVDEVAEILVQYKGSDQVLYVPIIRPIAGLRGCSNFSMHNWRTFVHSSLFLQPLDYARHHSASSMQGDGTTASFPILRYDR